MSKPLDETLSKEIGEASKSKSDEPFENAYKAALMKEGSIYVQGFIVWAGKPYRPVEHGWVELENCIADPTFIHLNKKAGELYYFPAHRLTVKELQAAVEEAKEDYPEDEPLPVYGDGPYEYYGDRMLGGNDYEAAYKEAMAKSKELNQPSLN